MNNRVRKNPFAGYQKRKQDDREQIIRNYLKKSKSARLKFDNVTQLAEMAAAHITEVERSGEPCNSSTLLRNSRYRKNLDDYFKAEIPGGLGRIHNDIEFNPLEKLISLETKLERSNLRLENERLKKHLSTIESDIISGQSKLSNGNICENDELSEKIKKLECDLGSTCKALDLVLKHLSFYVQFDPGSRALIDPEPPAGKSGIIVEENYVYAYINWLASNEKRFGGA